MAEETKIICIGCPKGCSISVMHDGVNILSVDGYNCKNGLEYAKNEFISPKRTLTSTVKIKNGELPLIPVKTRNAISKDKIFECMKEICKIEVEAPVELGTVLISDIDGTGVDLIATRSVHKKHTRTA